MSRANSLKKKIQSTQCHEKSMLKMQVVVFQAAKK